MPCFLSGFGLSLLESSLRLCFRIFGNFRNQVSHFTGSSFRSFSLESDDPLFVVLLFEVNATKLSNSISLLYFSFTAYLEEGNYMHRA